MPDRNGNSSFIPKRGAGNNIRKSRSVNIHVLQIISYTLFFSALVAAVGVYFYNNYTKNIFNDEVVVMSEAVSIFREADLLQVQAFDQRLQQAADRLENSASVVAVLNTLEENIADSVKLTAISLERQLDRRFIISMEVTTDSYDSSIFQRDIFSNTELIEVVEVSEVLLQREADVVAVGDVAEVSSAASTSVDLLVQIAVELADVPAEPDKNLFLLQRSGSSLGDALIGEAEAEVADEAVVEDVSEDTNDLEASTSETVTDESDTPEVAVDEGNQTDI